MGELAQSHASHADHADSGHAREGHGAMDIRQHKATFDGFMSVTVWTSALVAMTVALITVAFAIPGGGWFGGVLAYALIGVGAGLAMNLGAAWWATLIVSSVLMLVGGAIVSVFF